MPQDAGHLMTNFPDGCLTHICNILLYLENAFIYIYIGEKYLGLANSQVYQGQKANFCLYILFVSHTMS